MGVAGVSVGNDFWKKRGFRKLDGVVTELAWKDIGDSEASKKAMQYWIKEL